MTSNTHNDSKPSWSIGRYPIDGRAVLAPMAGVSDHPFRKLCLDFGAAMATAEMTASAAQLRNTLKSRLRLSDRADREPRTVQIVGNCPEQMAEAAEYQVAKGAQIVDINMGCPAKKVCNRAAGSALLAEPALVEAILLAVVQRVDVPVTLKIRTGTSPDHINGVEIAKLAEQCGIQSLAVHGRTRACKFRGQAEYDTIAQIADCLSIPVLANGDITSANDAQNVLKKTGATAVMIGRGAQGRPWIFSEINDLLDYSREKSGLLTDKSALTNGRFDIGHLIIGHLRDIHRFYDRAMDDSIGNSAMEVRKKPDFSESSPKLSVRVARKHICWYFEQLEKMSLAPDHAEPSAPTMLSAENKNCRSTVLRGAVNLTEHHSNQGRSDAFQSARRLFNRLQCQSSQLEFIDQFFAELRTTGVTAA